ncbi:MAG: carboxypeptidase regulatory-like domain-containing protein [Deltaproteobacteria bacterium]|nr:carboxypeptidase regulatory-like domain-containing protein [Deltaproteobacteria bacterium]
MRSDCGGLRERRSRARALRLSGIVVLSLLLSLACLDPIPDDTLLPPGMGTLTGSIRDACDAKILLRGVTVIVSDQTTQTDAQGSFFLKPLAAGLHNMRVAKADYQTQDKSVQIDSGQTTSIIVDLMPKVTALPSSPSLDVLFVVDNSGSMVQEQRALEMAFPAFLHELRVAKVNLRIGIISTDMGAGNWGLPSCEVAGGDGGTLQFKPRDVGCSPPGNAWIAVHGDQDNVASGTVEDAFSCIASLGINGCGFEQPLAAILRALEDPPGVNAGFLRKDASLAVVILSDEDDCSAKDPSLFDPNHQGLQDPLGPLSSFRCFEFGVRCDVNDRNAEGPRHDCVPASTGGYLLDVKDVIARLKSFVGPRPLFFSVIAGPTSPLVVAKDGSNPVLSPSCQTSSGFAVPAIRLNAVAKAFSPRSSFDSICTDDLTPTLRSVAKKIIATALLNACAGR